MVDVLIINEYFFTIGSQLQSEVVMISNADDSAKLLSQNNSIICDRTPMIKVHDRPTKHPFETAVVYVIEMR